MRPGWLETASSTSKRRVATISFACLQGGDTGRKARASWLMLPPKPPQMSVRLWFRELICASKKPEFSGSRQSLQLIHRHAELMANIRPANPEDDVGRDVRGVIRDTLQIASHENAIHCLLGELGLVLNHLQQDGGRPAGQ